MAQYKVYDPEDTIPCPYNRCEMIRVKRMPYHLIKCRRQHPCSEFATCPLNATHVVPKPELRFHIDTCADKARVEQDFAYAESKKGNGNGLFKGSTQLPKYRQLNLASDEDWEKEIPIFPRIGVDPNFLAKLDGIQIQGLTTTEKRYMKAQYHLPPQERRYPENPDKPVEDEVVEKTKDSEEEEELRIPHKASQTYVPKPKPTRQPPSTVFTYSLSSAGVGRGQIADVRKEQGASRGDVGVGEQEISEEGVGRGGILVSVGRGTIGVGRGMAGVDMEGDQSSARSIGRGQIRRENQPSMGLAGELFGVGTGRGVSMLNVDKRDLKIGRGLRDCTTGRQSSL